MSIFSTSAAAGSVAFVGPTGDGCKLIVPLPTQESPIALPDRVRLPLAFDPARLAADLACFGPGDWTDHFVRRNYDGEWSALPLRAPAGETHPIRMISPDPGATCFVDTVFLDRALYLREVLAAFRCPLRAARLMRLSPGSAIKEHEDPNLDAGCGFARLHVPILTGADVEFLVNGRPVEMAPGSAWYLRLADPHSVTNRGAEDRVHLVIDAEVNDWLVEMLVSAARSGRSADRGGCSRS